MDSVSDVEVYGQVLYSYYVLQFLISGLILCALCRLYVMLCCVSATFVNVFSCCKSHF